MKDAPGATEGEGEELLGDAEIEALLLAESAGLPPPSDAPAQPVPVAMREPGQGRFGRWAVWLVILFILFSAAQMMR
jgi:hypothetical protein